MAGPTAATLMARRMLPAEGWAAGIALLTVAFSAGQAIGPVLSGLLSDGPGGVARGLWLSVALLGVAALVALWQREHERRERPRGAHRRVDDGVRRRRAGAVR